MAKQIIITSKLTFYNGCTRRINRLKQLGWLNEDTRGTVLYARDSSCKGTCAKQIKRADSITLPALLS